MLASHNSYTYLAPRRWWHKLTTPFWRCQSQSIPAQIEAGASLIDIRVRWDAGKRAWRPCHGLVDLGRAAYPYLGALARRDIPCRIILERGSENATRIFTIAIEELLDLGIPISIAAVKRGWGIIYRNDILDGRCQDHFFKPFDSALSLWTNLRHLICHPSTITRFAKQQDANRPHWAADPDHYHLIDLI